MAISKIRASQFRGVVVISGTRPTLPCIPHADSDSITHSITNTGDSEVVRWELPGNILTVGDVLRADLSGTIVNNSAAGRNYTFSLNSGSFFDISSGSLAASATAKAWRLSAWMYVSAGLDLCPMSAILAVDTLTNAYRIPSGSCGSVSVDRNLVFAITSPVDTATQTLVLRHWSIKHIPYAPA